MSDSKKKNKIKMYLGIPSTGNRSDAQCYTLRELERQYGEAIEFVYPPSCTMRIFHDFARNAIVEDFLKTDCDVLWFLDSDIVPPTSVLLLITEHWEKWKCAGAPYPLFLTPQGHDTPKVNFAIYTDYGYGYNPAPLPPSGTDFVNGIATGCIFVKREIFEQMERPWFEFKYDEKTRKMTIGEDIGFCKKVNAMGHKFFIDYSMLCRHFKTVDLLDVNNYVISEFNVRMLDYDRMIRSQIAKVRLGIDEKKRAEKKSVLELPSSLICAP